MSYFLTLSIEGALAGSVYALVALAFVLVYKASSMMNFALGEFVMFGALLSATGLQALHLGWAAALLFAGLAMVAFAAGFYRLVVRRLIGRPAISAVIATLGVGMVMRGSGPLLFSGSGNLVSEVAALAPVEVGGLIVAADRLIAAAIAALCTAVIAVFYRFSRTGVALRAIADDRQAAMSMGIDIDRHLMFVWGLGGAISVIAGTLWTLVTGGGFGLALVGLKIFPIVILGGLDSIAGTAVAAIAMGIVESLASGYLDEPLGSGFGGLAPYLFLVAALLFRPHGLFGQPRVERV